MKNKLKKKLLIIFAILITIISFAAYYVFAENELTAGEGTNVEDTVGATAGDNEATYVHYGRYIRGNDEADNVRYISQQQQAAVAAYLYDAYTCSGGRYWWNCSNHATAWRKLKEYGVFSQEDYDAYAGRQREFQNLYLEYTYVPGYGYQYRLKNMITDIFQAEVNSQCTIGMLVSYLNNVDSNAVKVLYQFSSVFCLKHNCAVPNWRDTWGHTNTFVSNDYITATYDTNSRSITGGDVTKVTYSNLNDYKDKSEATSQVTKSNIKYFVTNENAEDLHTVNNGFGTYKTNVFLYALSFSEKLSKPGYLSDNYRNERAQRSIWGVVGGDEYSFRNDDLYKAAKSVDEFEAQVKAYGENPKISKRGGDTHKVTSAETVNGVNAVGEHAYEPTGTTIYVNSDGETVYKIGPFNMSNYAYAANSEVPGFSGSTVSVDHSLVGGIIYGELVLSNGITVPIGYNEKVGGSSTEFVRTDGVGNAKIVYVDTKGNATSKGNYNRSGTYFYAPSGYQYPWPNSVFYIEVPVSACGNATTLSSVNFQYRKTYTEGTGWVVTGKYVECKWEVDGVKTGCTSYRVHCGHYYHYKTVSNYDSSKTISWNHYYSCGGCKYAGKDKNGNSIYTCPGTHVCKGSASGTCTSHGHDACQSFKWKNTKCEMELAQPFLAVHDACTKVDTYDKTSSLNVRLTTKITIDKYVYSVEHTNKNEQRSTMNSYKNYDNKYDSEFTNANRAGWSDSTKKSNSVKLERGDKVTYRIVLKNHSNYATQVQVKDVLPNYCIFDDVSVSTYYLHKDSDGKYNNGKYFITTWLEVPANGTKTFTVTVVATASDASIENKNTATIVTGNYGRDIGDGIDIYDDRINYARGTSGKGAVVNTAQISGSELYKILRSSEYYKVKSYNIVLDKYITKVEHELTGEVTYERYNGSVDISNDSWINLNTGHSDRDTYNDDSPNSGKKKDNPVYVEYGDRVTYDIDIQNTWYANNKEIDQKSGLDPTVNVYPYYAPNYVYVDITDTLPSCYEPNTLKVEYIVHETTYGNAQIQDQFIDSYGTRTYNPSVSGNKFSLEGLYVNPCSEATIRVSYVVNTNETGKAFKNYVELDSDISTGYGNTLSYAVTNINNYKVYNTPNKAGAKVRVTSADYFVLNDYKVAIDKYISDYGEEMLQDNISKDFEEHYSTDLSGREMQSNEYLADHPVSVEKNESLEYTIKVYNNSISETKTSGTGSYYKPQTTVRASTVRDTLAEGLVFKDVTAKIVTKSGAVRNVTVKAVNKGGNVYDFNIFNKENGNYTVLEPGEYIEYKVKVEVSRTNMELYNLENKADIYTLTDINNKSSKETGTPPTSGDHTRKVTNRNTSDRQTSSDYIRLKDLIISGKVWLDLNRDGLMDSYNGLPSLKHGDSSDVNSERVMEGIIVRLYEKGNSTPIRTTLTDSNGLYTFARVDFPNGADINSYSYNYRPGMEQRVNKATNKDANGNYIASSKYKEYYVEFEYDGLVYKSTDAYSNANNLKDDGTFKTDNYKIDSNAAETVNDRKIQNERYELITYNKAQTIDKTNPWELTYDKKGHTSHLNIDHNRDMTATSFINPGNGVINYLWLYETNDNFTYPETEYLKYINLGLEERDKFDLRTTKDLMKVDVSINDYDMEYEYGQLNENALYNKADAYKLYIYDTDHKFRYEMYENDAVRTNKSVKNEYGDIACELRVDLTYKITVYNESSDETYARIREIVDYNTSTMTLRKATMNGNTISFSPTSTLNDTSLYSFAGYETNFLTGMENAVIPKDGKIEIFLVYSADKLKPNDIYPTVEDARTMYLDTKHNIAQISAYSAYEDAAGTVSKGLVDYNANAGNVNKECVHIEDVNKYEDNTYRVSVDFLTKTTERQINGFVFEDVRTDKVPIFNQYIGNGLYNSSDKKNTGIKAMLESSKMITNPEQDIQNDLKLDGMTVELVEVITVDGQVYEETIDPLQFKANNKNNVIVRTQTANGTYVIDSFIPGKYLVRFRYGDTYVDNTMTKNSLLHNGQDYRSTTYTLKDASGKTLENAANYANNEEVYNALVQPDRSDARDNEFRRIEVMAESEIMTHDVAEFLKYTNYDISDVSKLKEFSDATNCFADTLVVSLGIENRIDTKDHLGEEVEYKDFNKISVLMPNIDFGVTFRPENFMEITKKIKNITLITASGEKLIDIEYNMDGTIKSEIGGHNVQALDTVGTQQGFRYINVDESILQGATLSVEYYMIVDNIGEVDTVNKFLIEKGGSTKILEALNANRASVIQSKLAAPLSGNRDNYIRAAQLFNATYTGNTYKYGTFVGDIYYSGLGADTTDVVVVPITVSKILDFVDNDATFVQANNSAKDRYWVMTSEEDLLSNGLIGTKGLADTKKYVDNESRDYTTDNKKNLAINVATNKENPKLVTPIIPEYTGKIDATQSTQSHVTIQIDSVLGGDNDTEDMVYDNVAEVVEFITPVGRRTNFASTIGNIEIKGTTKPFDAAQKEVDTDGTEVIRLTPPTGMTEATLFISGNKNTFVVIAMIPAVFIVFLILKRSLKGKVGKNKIYK